MRCSNCNGSHHKSICTKGVSTPPVGSTTTTTSSTGLSNVSNQPPQSNATRLSRTSQVPPNQSNTDTLSQVPLNPDAATYTAPTPTSTSLYVSGNESVYLQTALAEVYNPRDPGLVVKVRLILDSGSQRSYVSNEIKEVLGLDPQDRQCLSIATFGAEVRTKVSETVCVGMKMKYGADQHFRVLVP